MNPDRYSMSFTTGALFRSESVNLATWYLEKDDWDEVRDDVISRNLLQLRTLNSRKRIFREICSRMKRLNRDELELLVEGDHQEQGYLLWLAICRRYRFLYDFSVEVLRERYLTFKYDLDYEDFDAFFNSKMEWHEEMERITTTTQNKLRQVMFKMLHESGLINPDNYIVPALLSSRLINVIRRYSNRDLCLFPIIEPGSAN